MDSFIKEWEDSQGQNCKRASNLSNIPSDTSVDIAVNAILINKNNIHKTLEERVAGSNRKIKFSNEISWWKPKGLEVW